MKSNEVLEWLIGWFQNRGASAELLKKDPTANYLELGLIDSMGLMELITAIEEKFQVRLNENHFQDPRFLTLQGLSDIVLSLRP